MKEKVIPFFFFTYSARKEGNKVKVLRRENRKKVEIYMNISVWLSLGPWIRDIALFLLFRNSMQNQSQCETYPSTRAKEVAHICKLDSNVSGYKLGLGSFIYGKKRLQDLYKIKQF